jgi:hypothetical protein
MMTDAALPLSSTKPTPPFMAVFSEQLGLIGRAHWRELAILVGFSGLMTAAALWEITRHRMTVDFPMEAITLVALFAMAMGLAVWGPENLHKQGHLTSLPVDRHRHILIRTLAGGVWLFGIVAWMLVWIAVMGLVSGSDLGVERYRLLTDLPPDGHVTLDAVRPFRWTPQTWNWLSAFSTAAVFYLLSSAFVIGVRRIVLWSVVATVVFLAMALDPTGTSEAVLRALVGDPLGLDNMMTGGLNRVEVQVTLPGDRLVNAWRDLPSLQNWAPAAGAWLALSGGLLWLAAWRHRER